MAAISSPSTFRWRCGGITITLGDVLHGAKFEPGFADAGWGGTSDIDFQTCPIRLGNTAAVEWFGKFT